MYAPPAVADVLNRLRGPFNVPGPAQAAGIAALGDPAFVETCRNENARLRARLADAVRTYTSLQRFTAEVGAAEHDLGAIALMQNRGTDAAWYLRRAVKSQPRVLATWRALTF